MLSRLNRFVYTVPVSYGRWESNPRIRKNIELNFVCFAKLLPYVLFEKQSSRLCS